ncbi:hypothetical protein PISMIDRAFT_426189 [Pisolithus microcarpus 441]|uniref:Uncharacterized protein n=1 Tax=Pisolithus microcarpus 441 TaxID=765257 RepID=A0A0C9Z4G2_9AGAM|nr:hypothetical protein PISMIDRAFT_426189 [Pisolithus microcarpus 441]
MDCCISTTLGFGDIQAPFTLPPVVGIMSMRDSSATSLGQTIQTLVAWYTTKLVETALNSQDDRRE